MLQTIFSSKQNYCQQLKEKASVGAAAISLFTALHWRGCKTFLWFLLLSFVALWLMPLLSRFRLGGPFVFPSFNYGLKTVE